MHQPDEGPRLTPGDIVWVPFPHVEENRLRSRPALIVASGLAGSLDLCWALMITSATNGSWPGDIVIADHAKAGLPVPSRIRTGKIATLAAGTATWIGHLPDAIRSDVQTQLAAILGIERGAMTKQG